MPTWDELFAYRQELEKHPAELKALEKIWTMYRRYGHGPDGARCKDCVQFERVQFAKTYFKCRLFGDSRGPGTDWRARFLACGKFERAE